MPRKLMLFAVLAVVGSMLVLWLATRGTSVESADAPTADRFSSREPPARGDTSRPGLPTDPARPRVVDPQDPANPPHPAASTDPSADDPTRRGGTRVDSVDRGTHADRVTAPPLEYTLPDGRRVRDFRDPANRKPLDLPPSVHAPGGRKIKPELTGALSDQILTHMRECRKAVPTDAFGAKPRMTGQIVIAIKQETASVTNAVVLFEDITSPAAIDAAKQCVEQKALTVTAPAAGEADLDSYSINLSLAFR